MIVNPTAGNGRGKKVYESVKKLPLYAELTTMEYVTEYEGHATEIVQQVERYDSIEAIIVIGGEGTMNEVVNGLTKNIPLSFIPAGSGNDFYRGIGQPKHPVQILQNIVQTNNVKSYSYARVRDEQHEKSFINCIGFGFDAFVVKRANQSYLKMSSIIRPWDAYLRLCINC